MTITENTEDNELMEADVQINSTPDQNDPDADWDLDW
jgi:hypothetical protein